MTESGYPPAYGSAAKPVYPPAAGYSALPTGSESTPLQAGTAGYPAQYGNAPGYGYQQQQHVVVGQPTTTVIYNTTVSFTGYIILSCLVFWFCGWVIGLIAFVFAVMAQNTSPTDLPGARRLARISLVMSIIGIVVGIIVVVVVVAVKFSGCRYAYNGQCYRHRDDYSTYDLCDLHIGRHAYDRFNRYCYYDY